MKILIIGGTRFLGRHLVTSARAHGHEVTLFNRNQSNPGLFRRITTPIYGNRETDLHLLNSEWDAVIDTCGYLPHTVRLSAKALKDRVEHYIFISSVSAYINFSSIGITEEHPLAALQDPNTTEITNETYGALKALCEKTVQTLYGSRAIILRPGLIIGPHDPTDRFTYWPLRIARGGNILAPDRPNAMTQFIDARDLADFTLKLAHDHTTGIFNAVGHPITLNTVFETCKKISQSDAIFKWAPIEFFEKHQVTPWSDLPAWLPETAETSGAAHISNFKATRAGLTFTPLAQTIRDIYKWENETSGPRPLKAGLTPQREQELLELLAHVQ